MKKNVTTEKSNPKQFKTKKRPFYVEVLNPEEGLLPEYKTNSAAAADIKADGDYTIEPGKRVKVSVGLKIKFPNGFVGLITPRSGKAWEHGITVLNAPGFIDPDYRDDVGVILINLGDEPYEIKKGDRIAQLSFVQVKHARFKAVEEFSPDHNNNRTGGFGSTDKEVEPSDEAIDSGEPVADEGAE